MGKSLVFLVLFLFGVFAGATNSPSVPPDVRVEVENVSGSGCPSGTYSAAISPDGQVVSIQILRR
jgi:uncharacterized membrane protein YedE/YeeE